MYFKVNWKIHVNCFLLSIVLMAFFYNNLNIIVNKFFTGYLVSYPSNQMLWFFISVTGFIIFFTWAHELIHGICFKMFGGKVKYGFRIVYAYTQEISGKPLSRTQFLIVLLSPVVILSILSIFLNDWLGGALFIFNLLGSTGDIFMAFYLCRYGSHHKIIDRNYGFEVIE